MDLHEIHIKPTLVVAEPDECNISMTLGNRTFALPIIARCTSDDEATEFADMGCLYVMETQDLKRFVTLMNYKGHVVSVSVDASPDKLSEIKELVEGGLRIDYITVKVPHAHSARVRNFLDEMRKVCPGSFIICGDVCTVDAVEYLQGHCDAIVYGNRHSPETGCGEVTPQVLNNCAVVSLVPLIADVLDDRTDPGDLAKLIAIGATASYYLPGYSGSDAHFIDYLKATLAETLSYSGHKQIKDMRI